MKTDLLLFAMRLKSLRRKRHLTLEKLAELAELTPNHIAKLEAAKSNPSFTALSNLSKALNIEMKDLFDYEDFKKPEYIAQKLKNVLENADTKYLHLLYKIHKSLTE